MTYKIIALFLVSILLLPIEAMSQPAYPDLLILSPNELYKKGNEFLNQSKADSAMKYFSVLTGSYTPKMSQAEKRLCVDAYKKMGSYYFYQEDYATAYNFWMEGLQLAEKEKFNDLSPFFYNNIANVLNIFNEPSIGMNYYEKGLKTALANNCHEDYTKLLINISMLYINDGQLDKANYYYDKLKSRVATDTTATAQHYMSYLAAQIFEKEHKYDQAIEQCRKAMKIAEKNIMTGNVSSSYNYMANLFMKIGQKDSMISYLHKNADYSQLHQLSYHRKSNLLNLAEYYKSIGDKQRSNEYKQAYWELSDSLFNQKKATEVKNSVFAFEIKKNYQEIADLTRRNELADEEIKFQKLRSLFFFGGMVVAVCFLLYVYRQKKQLMQTYRKLYEQNKELAIFKEEAIKRENKVAENFSVAQVYNTNENTEKTSNTTPKIPDQRRIELSGKILHIMHETKEFCQTDFTLDKLAGMTDSNTTYVSQTINEMFNCNFRTMLSRYRIQEAESLLRTAEIYSSQTIQSIAESVGYKSSWSFTQHFKEITGMTPSIYIKLLKEEKARCHTDDTSRKNSSTDL